MLRTSVLLVVVIEFVGHYKDQQKGKVGKAAEEQAPGVFCGGVAPELVGAE